MAHVFETAPTGRARCRGCGEPIAKGDVRFGERMPNPFAEGEMTHWFHPECAAHKRPEPFLEAVSEWETPIDDAERLTSVAQAGTAHRRLPRIDGAERAPSGRARCRSCREPISKDAWRIRLVFYQDGRFEPAGFVHVCCSAAYFETTDVIDRLRHFSRLTEEDLVAIAADLGPSS